MNEAKIAKIADFLQGADGVLIGAGAGLSASAGLDYAGESFRREFAPWISRYGFTDLYSSGFYPFATEEAKWAYWAKHVEFSRFRPAALPAYRELKEIVSGRDYFVLTTNVDGQFEKAGFPGNRVFATQGDYAEMQCAKGCHRRVYGNRETVERILANMENLAADPATVPRCPVCNGPMDMHLRKDKYFIEDEAWERAAENYQEFLEKMRGQRLLLLELGVGFNTPGIIRQPFEILTMRNPGYLLARINQDHPQKPALLSDRAISLAGDAARILHLLLMRLASPQNTNPVSDLSRSR